VQYTYNYVWDANKVKGCVCDIRFEGYDCSLRTCPTGDDPLTTGQVSIERSLQSYLESILAHLNIHSIAGE